MILCSNGRRGLVLGELLLAVAILLLLGILLLPAMHSTRRLASLGESMNNLRWIGQCHIQYTADNQEKFAAFNWTKGNCPSSYTDLQNATDDIQAAANQAVDIIRRLWDPTYSKIVAWIPHINHNWLVLADYQQMRLPARIFASPEDAKLLLWQTNPKTNYGFGWNVRAPFYSSYTSLSTSFFDQSPLGSRWYPAESYNTLYIPSGGILRQRSTPDVVYPSQKAMSWARCQRNYGSRAAYYGYSEARIPMLFVDGSIAQRKTGDSNLGWDPNNPSSPNYYVAYGISGNGSWDPPKLYAQTGDDVFPIRYDWTRNFLAGRDFDGHNSP